jgi:hypothetical protein
MGAEVEAVDKAYLRDLLGVTPNGKEIYMMRKPNAPLRRIAFGSGGQLPECLEGGYSSVLMAQSAVDSYIAELEDAAAKQKGRKSK